MAKRRKQALEEEELPEEPAAEEPEAEPEYAAEEPERSEEEHEYARPAEQEDVKNPEALKISKKLLIIGCLLCLSGLIGYLGLRWGIIQFLFGDSDPYPGIGHVEPSGHVVSSIPFVLGLVFVAIWGIRNDPIYKEIERTKKEQEELEEEEPESVPQELTRPMADLEAELDDIGDLGPAPGIEEEVAPSAYPTEEAPTSEAPPMDSQIAEKMRVERCETILRAVIILPDDREKLTALIRTNISVEDFTEKIKEAVNRRKKKEQEKNVTADEKAAILEDELVAELGDLETGMKDEGNEDLEEEILKEIEDLEHL